MGWVSGVEGWGGSGSSIMAERMQRIDRNRH